MKLKLVRTAALIIACMLLFATGCKNDNDADSVTLDVPEASAPVKTPPPAVQLATPDPAVAVASPLPEPDGIPDPGEETPPPKMSYDKDYERYKKLNSDVIGWISVPNTRIEYPVVRGTDNEFYLHHTPEKKYSKSGSIFMDFRNAKESQQRNIIIYGHNMRNGTMFHDLTSYKVKDFFNNANTITLYWGDEKVVYDVYAAFIVTADVYFIRTEFKSDEDFVEYMNELRKQSKFNPKKEIKLDKDSQVLTLSTCTYEYDNSRYVVQAVRRK